MKRALAFVVGAVCVWGCGDSGPSAPPAVTPPPVTPAPPPAPEPPPDPEGDIVVGFAQERVEIREGQTIPLEVRFDADINLSQAWFHQLTVPLRVTVEGESGSADDARSPCGQRARGSLQNPSGKPAPNPKSVKFPNSISPLSEANSNLAERKAD